MHSIFKPALVSTSLALALVGKPVSAEVSLPGDAPAPFAQRAVLYEEDGSPFGTRYVGSVTWRSRALTPGPGQSAELAIDADIQVPDRRLSASWTLRRNQDQTLPASHTIEIVFKRRTDSSPDAITNVPGIMMKPAETARGTPLSGLAVRVADFNFMIGLSNADAEKQRNLQLLQERDWFDIPFVYNNNRRAVLAIEKGASGRRVFQEVLGSWGQAQPQPGPVPPKVSLQTSSASGFFITTYGRVVTSARAVQGCTSIELRMPNGKVPAQVLALHELDDIGVLESGAEVETVAALRLAPPRAGDAVALFGFPLSDVLGSSGSVSLGHVTAVDGLRDDLQKFQLSTPVQRGANGGPVLDMTGSVVGFAVAQADALRLAGLTRELPAHVNFAVKASALANYLDARGIGYSRAEGGEPLPMPDVAERARAFSVEVLCER